MFLLIKQYFSCCLPWQSELVVSTRLAIYHRTRNSLTPASLYTLSPNLGQSPGPLMSLIRRLEYLVYPRFSIVMTKFYTFALFDCWHEYV